MGQKCVGGFIAHTERYYYYFLLVIVYNSCWQCTRYLVLVAR